MNSQNTAPVFIHSLFRSGSTYIFNVFRRSKSGYWCYQEPLHEHLIHAATKPHKLLEPDKEMQRKLRHPELKKPYFYEFYVIADEVGQTFRKEFSYKQYFTSSKEDIANLKTYFSVLIKNAKGRPVLQCCRTMGRIAQLQQAHNGVHIFLYRNPWDQWWSYKNDGNFDIANLLISNAENPPNYITNLKKELGIKNFHGKNTQQDIKFFNGNRLDPISTYKLFYALWSHAMLEARPLCNLSISIDQLSTSNTYRNKTIAELELAGIEGLEFTDCSVPIATYGEDDGAFFLGAENQIHQLLLANGYSEEQVNHLKQLSKKRSESLVDTTLPENFTVRDAMRAREIAQQSEAEIVEVQRLLFSVRTQAEQAEAKVEQAEAKAEQAEAKAEQAEAKAEQAEAKAEQAEAKAEQAEAKVEQAEAKALKFHSELLLLYASRSWLITRPLRDLSLMLNRLIALSSRLLKRHLNHLTTFIISRIRRHPTLMIRLRAATIRFPRFYARARNIARGAVDIKMRKSAPNLSSARGKHVGDLKGPIASLTPSAKVIYLDLLDLQAGIKNREEK